MRHPNAWYLGDVATLDGERRAEILSFHGLAVEIRFLDGPRKDSITRVYWDALHRNQGAARAAH